MNEEQRRALFEALRILASAGVEGKLEADSLIAKIGRIEIDAPKGVGIGCTIKLDGITAPGLMGLKVEGHVTERWRITLELAG